MRLPKLSVFARWLLSSLAILAVPVLIGSLLIHNARLLVLSEFDSVNSALQKELDNSIGSYMYEVTKFRFLLSNNPQIDRFMRLKAPVTLSQRGQLRDIFDMLKSYRGFENTNSCYIYLSNTDTLLSTASVIPGSLITSEEFRNNEFRYVDVAAYMNEFHAGKIQMIEIPDTGQVVPVMLTSLPTEPYSKPMALLFQVLNTSAIEQIMRNMTTDERTEILLTDQAGRVIAANRSYTENRFPHMSLLTGDEGRLETELGGEGRLILYNSVRDQPDWKLVTIISMESVVERTKPIQTNSIMFILLSLVLGTVLTALLTRRNYQPVHRIMNEISPYADDSIDDPFEKIVRAVRSMSTTNEKWMDMWSEQERFLQENFLKSALYGSVADVPAIRKILGSINLELDGKLFCVMIFAEGGEEHEDVPAAIVEELLEYLATPDTVYYPVKAEDHVVVLAGLSGDAEDAYGRLCQRLSEAEARFSLLIAVSDTCRTLNRIGSCRENVSRYMAEKQACRQSTGELRDVRCDFREDFGSFGLLPQQETLIYDSVYVGDLDSAVKAFRAALSSGEFGKHATNRYRCFAGSMVSAVWNARRRLAGSQSPQQKKELERLTGEFLSEPIPERAAVVMESMLACLCAEFHRDCEAHEPLFESLVAQINDNYTDADFNVTRLAELMGMNLSYLSKYFKASTGIGLADYINRLRVNTGKQLLLEKKLSVTKVAQAVGYDNLSSFIRTFKKFEHVTPSLYRSGTGQKPQVNDGAEERRFLLEESVQGN